VWSALRFGTSPEAIKPIRIAPGGADLVLGCDMIVAGNSKTLALTHKGRTRMVINTAQTMPGEFSRNADMRFPARGLRKNITDSVGDEQAEFVDASRIAVDLLGDSIAANMFMLGFAYQRGLIPLSAEAIEQAIEINGAAAQMNREAFVWGRRTAVDQAGVERLIAARSKTAQSGVSPAPMQSLEERIAWRRGFLVDYQSEKYAQGYEALVEQVRAFEQRRFPGKTALTDAVARYYFKLLAIKDEYEVARLHVSSGFLDQVGQQFEGDYKLVFNLAPPLLAKRDAATGQPVKREFGAWIVPVFKVLARLKSLRGTAFDVFGHTAERRLERALIVEYEQLIAQLLDRLGTARDAGAYDTAVALASIPEQIRGYGHIRAASIEQTRKQRETLLAALQRDGAPLKKVA